MSREVFSTCNPLAINCVLFQEEARTTLWGAGIYYDGVTCWDVNSSGVITGTAACTTTTSTTSTTTSTTTEAPAYNYYTLTPCIGGAGTDYRSILSLALNAVYAFQASPPDRQCYEITDITAAVNNNDLPTLFGPKSDCSDIDCIEL